MQVIFWSRIKNTTRTSSSSAVHRRHLLDYQSIILLHYLWRLSFQTPLSAPGLQMSAEDGNEFVLARYGNVTKSVSYCLYLLSRRSKEDRALYGYLWYGTTTDTTTYFKFQSPLLSLASFLSLLPPLLLTAAHRSPNGNEKSLSLPSQRTNATISRLHNRRYRRRLSILLPQRI